MALLYDKHLITTSKIFKMIQLLKHAEKCFDRPFMFKKKRYDENMHYEMKDVRERILEKCPTLKDHEKMNKVLLATGEIEDIR